MTPDFLTPEIEAAIKAHALAEYPREACGLIVAGVYRPCKNLAANSEGEFEIAPADYLAAGDALQAVVHSHRPALGAFPSAADMRGQIASAVPWGIVMCDGEKAFDLFWWGDQLAPPALLGRTFRHGVTDCYSIIRDWFRLERGIILKDFPRDDSWWERGEDLYALGFDAAGFRCYGRGPTAQPARVGDVLLYSYHRQAKGRPHHGAIYTGNGLILHHNSGLSRLETAGRWLPYTTHWLRHESDPA